MTKAIELFPERLIGGPPNSSQEIAIEAIEKAFRNKDIVVLEAPVGSGKSGIAITFARFFGEAHILTPRKALQGQYFNTFAPTVVSMKGRGAYPCTYRRPDGEYLDIISEIRKGDVPLISGVRMCDSGPCKGSKTIYDRCTEQGVKPCPYKEAVTVANANPIIVHNIHSFIFQSLYGGYFQQKPLLVLDEAHTLEGILRDFATRRFTVPRFFTEENLPDFDSLEEWASWLLSPEFVPREEDEREEYTERVNALLEEDKTLNDYVVHRESHFTHRVTKLEFIPKSLNGLAQGLIFNYGRKILLMSGTIYDAKYFCSRLGINPDRVASLKLSSSFPVENRPIYCKAWHSINTSHNYWEDNLFGIREILEKIFDTFHDCKGLIHAPSYLAASQIMEAMHNDRLRSHSPANFQQRLNEFFAEEGNPVFLSPACQEGVDFKGDKARFQVILRVPYPNTSDTFTKYLLQERYVDYNYRALVTFGQMIGRVNRDENDEGSTILLDSRFTSFIRKNSEKLPKWLKAAIAY